MALFKGGTEVINVTDNHYTLVDIYSYVETDAYTTTSSTNQFLCTDQSLTFTTTAQTHGADKFVFQCSLSANSNADDNGFGIYLVHSTASDFGSGTGTTIQTGRYGEALMNGEYTNTTAQCDLTGLTANTQYYLRMYAMIQRPSGGTVTINQDGYATAGNVRHGVVVHHFMKN